MPDLWDPLTYDNLMAGTVVHFEKQNRCPLNEAIYVEGPGIYALYYGGRLAEYSPISGTERPIYVGKAAPPGTRKGLEKVNIGHPALRTRLREHSRSIEHVSNLETVEFSYRSLGVMPVWIGFAEQALIKQYRPVWNTVLDGFGKHDQGSRRSRTERSWWDTMHPGRPWTEGETTTKTVAEVRDVLRRFWKDEEG